MKIDKSAIASAFGRAAESYDQSATVQKKVADRLFKEFLALHSGEDFNDYTLLDAGCGTGYLSQKGHRKGATVTALDLSLEMLAEAQEANVATYYAQGDIEQLPFEAERFDGVISSLAVQWCHSFAKAINELNRVRKSQGKVAVATLLEGSLRELDQAWRAVDNYKHTIDFISQREAKEALKRVKGELIIYEEVMEFPSLMALMRSLKNIGATTLKERRSGLMGRDALRRLEAAFLQNGGFKLTYVVGIALISAPK